jgi:hypothetical protein
LGEFRTEEHMREPTLQELHAAATGQVDAERSTSIADYCVIGAVAMRVRGDTAHAWDLTDDVTVARVRQVIQAGPGQCDALFNGPMEMRDAKYALIAVPAEDEEGGPQAKHEATFGRPYIFQLSKAEFEVLVRKGQRGPLGRVVISMAAVVRQLIRHAWSPIEIERFLRSDDVRQLARRQKRTRVLSAEDILKYIDEHLSLASENYKDMRQELARRKAGRS